MAYMYELCVWLEPRLNFISVYISWFELSTLPTKFKISQTKVKVLPIPYRTLSYFETLRTLTGNLHQGPEVVRKEDRGKIAAAAWVCRIR
jgi:hypothetical protein